MAHPTLLRGPWRRGWALDFHTVSSRFLGYDEHGHALYETARTPLGELMYRLKYRGDQAAASEIGAQAVAFLDLIPNSRERIDAVVPMPASTPRPAQPVLVIATDIASRLGKVCSQAVRKTRETPSLKDINDHDLRRELLEGAFTVDPSVSGRGVLLTDDLYRSGATATSATLALLASGADRVYFLAVTRTRRRT